MQTETKTEAGIFPKIKKGASTKEKTSIAQKIYQDLTQYRSIKSTCHWHEGYFLNALKQDNLYKFVFGESGSSEWRDFLSEIGISYTGAQQKMNLYDFYIVKHGIEPSLFDGINTNNLIMILPILQEKSKEDVLEWIEKCRSLTRNQLKTEIYGENTCTHHDTENIAVKVCKNCKKRIRN
jgi:rhamnogalacturonyl hydrolase YesR